MSFWTDKNVAVTGGAALVGSHLLEQLKKLKPKYIWTIDDLSSGLLANVPDGVGFVKHDLRDYPKTLAYLNKADVVIHLACAHGGRTYVDTHHLEMYQNLELDSAVFRAAYENNKNAKVYFMSSACAYPIDIQRNVDEYLHLNEDLLDYKHIRQPDGAYGFAKLAGELQLQAYQKAGMSTVIGRGFTIYGPRMKENHAIAALIAKTFIRQEPFEIYGDGNQKRNWTYVEDTARGILLATEKLDGEVVNIGTEEVNTPNSACKVIWELMDWRPNEIKYIPDMTGPLNRVADGRKAKKELGWEPSVSFVEGVKKTIDWYVQTHDRDTVRQSLQKDMFSR